MYGLVNEGIRQMVISVAGEDTWESMCREVGIPPEGFETLCPYDDSVTYRLVEVISNRLHIPQDEVLRRYGHYWITFTAEQGYGEIMRLFGTDFRSCLENLNRMHAHMGAMMPALSPPRFRVEASSSRDWIVHYYSFREGLGPMVLGLLEGLAKKYNECATINRIPKGTRSDHEEFDISVASP